MLKKMLRMLAWTRDQELDCDEAFRFFDELAEATLRGDDTRHLLPQVELHLQLCPDCREEFETLIRVLMEGDQDADVGPWPV